MNSYIGSKISELLQRTIVFGRMIKFSHTVFALPFALSSVIIASRDHGFSLWRLCWIVIAMVGARSAAMGFNRIADSGIDAANPRTSVREIPKGEISVSSAYLFVLASSAVFVMSAAMLGKLCFYLSFPVLAVLLGYSYTKRFTLFCHFYLGLAISLAPSGAWVAMTGSFSWVPLLLSLALMTHIAGFDILYACQDYEFDSKEGLHSIPARLGIKKALDISAYVHIASFVFFILIGVSAGLGIIYYISAIIIGILLVIEHRLVNPDDLSKVNIAFFHINSVISVVLFAGISFDVFFRW
jgi:4-hydroxybenzoate polyprenyltransferase